MPQAYIAMRLGALYRMAKPYIAMRKRNRPLIAAVDEAVEALEFTKFFELKSGHHLIRLLTPSGLASTFPSIVNAD